MHNPPLSIKNLNSMQDLLWLTFENKLDVPKVKEYHTKQKSKLRSICNEARSDYKKAVLLKKNAKIDTLDMVAHLHKLGTLATQDDAVLVRCVVYMC